MQLYRPVGLRELQHIYESGMRAFPPRLPEQPIFYPVLNATYATQIARDWNTKSHTFAGYVTAFVVDDSYADQFERRIVGGRLHEELWVPAQDLAAFNQHIVDSIVVRAAYFGPQFRGYVPEYGSLKGQSAVEQFIFLAGVWDASGVHFQREVRTNHLAVFLHYLFWQSYDFGSTTITAGHKLQVLTAINAIWREAFPNVVLPNTS